MREDDFIPDETDFPDEQPDFDPEAGLPDPPTRSTGTCCPP